MFIQVIGELIPFLSCLVFISICLDVKQITCCHAAVRMVQNGVFVLQFAHAFTKKNVHVC